MIKVCANPKCGAMFHTQRSASKYCCRACYDRVQSDAKRGRVPQELRPLTDELIDEIMNDPEIVGIRADIRKRFWGALQRGFGRRRLDLYEP